VLGAILVVCRDGYKPIDSGYPLSGLESIDTGMSTVAGAWLVLYPVEARTAPLRIFSSGMGNRWWPEVINNPKE